ncbi:hypothetical protein QVD17_18174 [Tagetes erecta]|uniref:Uncharacterized protein n=1 Tax=Tagetes erecta TaxID=13708 RepID=A0AAD8KHA3_TARER|nr:hypothetical protein QVD17_18174 [Tagetes erecta]
MTVRDEVEGKRGGWRGVFRLQRVKHTSLISSQIHTILSKLSIPTPFFCNLPFFVNRAHFLTKTENKSCIILTSNLDIKRYLVYMSRTGIQ